MSQASDSHGNSPYTLVPGEDQVEHCVTPSTSDMGRNHRTGFLGNLPTRVTESAANHDGLCWQIVSFSVFQRDHPRENSDSRQGKSWRCEGDGGEGGLEMQAGRGLVALAA